MKHGSFQRSPRRTLGHVGFGFLVLGTLLAMPKGCAICENLCSSVACTHSVAHERYESFEERSLSSTVWNLTK